MAGQEARDEICASLGFCRLWLGTTSSLANVAFQRQRHLYVVYRMSSNPNTDINVSTVNTHQTQLDDDQQTGASAILTNNMPSAPASSNNNGIADSRGIANDFQGSYYVGTDGSMAFGAPTRYLKIDVGDLPGGVERWDEALQEANRIYSNRIHNICCDNCHSHVCAALNRMNLKAYGISKWDMVKLCFLIFFRAKFVSVGGFLCQFLPTAILIMIFLLLTK